MELRDPGPMVAIPPGRAVLLDELGSAAIETLPAAETAVMLDLGGSLNRSGERWSGRFLMSPAQSGELIGSLMAAATKAGPEVLEIVSEESRLALMRELGIEGEG